ncbi:MULTISPECIES: hypothetical protein [unclassified Mesotoga]|nr:MULTISPECIES: hypothetical protein [unclassified Mesotoga]
MSEDLHDGEYLWISYYDTVFLKGNSYAVSFVQPAVKDTIE